MGRVPGDHDVVAEPAGVEPEVLGSVDAVENGAPIAPFAIRRDDNAEFRHVPHHKLSGVTLTAADVIVRPVTPTIGAEVVGVDLATAPDDEQVMQRIEQALYDHLG